MAAETLPTHIPTSDEAGAHLVEALHNDGTVTIRDATTGQATTARLAVQCRAS